MIDDDILSKFDNGLESDNGYESNTNGNSREVSPSPSLINGIEKLAVKRAVSFSEETDESEPDSPTLAPSIKRRRESIGADGGLNYSELLSKKVDVTIIIKSQIRLPVEQTLAKISTLTNGLSRKDKAAIYQKALDIARGLSGFKLISLLEKELIRI